jgi:hypothetical protein
VHRRFGRAVSGVLHLDPTADAELEMTNAGFVSALGAIFEHSPWVAQRAATARPFSSRLQLTTAMRSVVNAASVHERLAIATLVEPVARRNGGPRGSLLRSVRANCGAHG